MTPGTRTEAIFPSFIGFHQPTPFSTRQIKNVTYIYQLWGCPLYHTYFQNSKSYRGIEPRIDRYFLCANSSISIKLRHQDKLEIKLRDIDYYHPDYPDVQYWTKYRLHDHPEPNWGSVVESLSSCENFSWIPEKGSCKVCITMTGNNSMCIYILICLCHYSYKLPSTPKSM